MVDMRLRLYESRELIRIFGYERRKVTREWRNWCSEGLSYW
jgi:hypothetical protein